MTRHVRLAALWLVTVSLTSAVDGQTPPSDRLSLGDFVELEQVRDYFGGGGPEISPDGGRIVYTRWRVDKMNDRRKPALWLMNRDGTKNRQLVYAVSAAKWSADGTRIAYVTQGEPTGGQIFVRWM